MPSVVAKSKVMTLSDGLLSVIVKTKSVVPESPSRIVASAIVANAVSSFEIIPSPCASEIVAPLGLVRLRNSVSACSTVTSPSATAVTVFVVSPAAKVSVPVMAT